MLGMERGRRFYRLFDATDVLKGNRPLLGHFRGGQAVNRSIISCLECTPSFA